MRAADAVRAQQAAELCDAGEASEDGEEASGAAQEAALRYAGLRVLSEGERSGQTLDQFEEASRLLALHHAADAASQAKLHSLLADDATFCLCSGHAGAAPTVPPLRGRAAIMEHVKAHEIPRTRRSISCVHPAALLADGRTLTGFEIRIPADGSVERLQDVIGWDGAGRIASWVRVFEPRPTQRDWLQAIGAGRSHVLTTLLDAHATFAVSEGPGGMRVYSGTAETREALSAIASRMAGRISHIGRTRELSEWAFPAGMPASAHASARSAPATVRITQAVLIGSWRPLGAKWYGEKEVAMRETAEWRGRAITRLVWEGLPETHPQAAPVWERLRERRRRAKRASSRGVGNAGAGAAARPHNRRPAWDDTVTPPPASSRSGLKSAKDREPEPRPKDLGL